MESSPSARLPRPFLVRRLHSLLGFWLVIYLFEHLLVNSQSALLLDRETSHFVRMVDRIQELPFLNTIELLFLGLPFLLHMWWGIGILFTAKSNAHPTDGSAPALGRYPRNVAYSWQRITSWLLIAGIAAHIIHMRFVERPQEVIQDTVAHYLVVGPREGAEWIAKRASVQLYLPQTVDHHLLKRPLNANQVVFDAPTLGRGFLVVLWQTFHNPWMVALYSLLVVAASYHAFNGLWTFLITWGVTMTRPSQRIMRFATTGLMLLTTFFGLLAIWGTFLLT